MSQVGNQSFPAHKYVLLSRTGKVFKEIIGKCDGHDCYLEDMEELTPVAFQLILNVIYNNHSITQKGKSDCHLFRGNCL